MAGAACGGGQAGPLDAGRAGLGPSTTIVQALSPSVDVLFLIDDSSSMRLAQEKLLRDIPTFFDTLRSLPGGMPDLHVGVISSDMGAGDGTVSGCDATGGRRGIFQYTARGTCTNPGLDAGATFIANGRGLSNHTGTLPDTFRCIAALGETGCGFEHQLAAIARALGADGRPAPLENQGFLRPDANLAIVMLTNEDDCSASPGVPLFDTGSNTNIESQLGPSTNFRCNEFGHFCDQEGSRVHPSRHAPGNNVAVTVPYSSCRSNDTEGYLLSTRDVATAIKALKSDPSQVMVASIQGPPTPYTVGWRAPTTSDTSCGAASCPWPQIAPSCTGGDGSFGDPGVRTAEFVTHFGGLGLVLPICGDSFAPSLSRIAEVIGQTLGPRCISGQIEDDPAKDGLQPNCTVTAQVRQSNGAVMEKALPACSNIGPATGCWTATRTSPACTGGVSVMVAPDASIADAVSLTIKCYTCRSSGFDPNCF
jgi:hypothetical protein